MFPCQFSRGLLGTSASIEATTLRFMITRAHSCWGTHLAIDSPATRPQETTRNVRQALSAFSNAKNRHSPNKSHPGLEHTEWHRMSRTSIHASCFRSRGVSPLCLADCSIVSRIQARQATACRFPGQTMFHRGRVSGGSPRLATKPQAALVVMNSRFQINSNFCFGMSANSGYEQHMHVRKVLTTAGRLYMIKRIGVMLLPLPEINGSSINAQPKKHIP